MSSHLAAKGQDQAPQGALCSGELLVGRKRHDKHCSASRLFTAKRTTYQATTTVRVWAKTSQDYRQILLSQPLVKHALTPPRRHLAQTQPAASIHTISTRGSSNNEALVSSHTCLFAIIARYAAAGHQTFDGANPVCHCGRVFDVCI